MYNYGGYWIDATLFFLKRFPLDEVIGDEDLGLSDSVHYPDVSMSME